MAESLLGEFTVLLEPCAIEDDQVEVLIEA
jgi:hypothetical protein